MPTRSQQAVIDWDYGYGGASDNSGASAMNPLEAYTLQQYMNFPAALQSAMGQMYGVNAGNQQAKLYNNALNAQLAGLLGTAQWDAYGQMGQGYMQRLLQNDLLSNPLYAEQVRGNLGTEIAKLQNQGALDAISAKGQIAKDLFGSFMGSFGGAFGGGGGGLRGFEATDGSGLRAVLPTQSAGTPVPQQATTGAAPVPAMPTAPTAQAPMPQPTGGTPNYFAGGGAARSGGSNPAHAMSIKYLQDYLARGGR